MALRLTSLLTACYGRDNITVSHLQDHCRWSHSEIRPMAKGAEVSERLTERKSAHRRCRRWGLPFLLKMRQPHIASDPFLDRPTAGRMAPCHAYGLDSRVRGHGDQDRQLDGGREADVPEKSGAGGGAPQPSTQ